MVRTVEPRDRTPGWRTSVVGIGMVVAMTAGIGAVGFILAVAMQLMTS